MSVSTSYTRRIAQCECVNTTHTRIHLLFASKYPDPLGFARPAITLANGKIDQIEKLYLTLYINNWNVLTADAFSPGNVVSHVVWKLRPNHKLHNALHLDR